jgi:hypothetical protein
MVKPQNSTRAGAKASAKNVGSKALAEQAKDAAVPDDRFKARRDADDTARKRHAKATGGNLFPEVKPYDGQIVLATKAARVGAPQFMAEYRATAPSGVDGAFYSNLNGAYSMLEGSVDSWTEVPG